MWNNGKVVLEVPPFLNMDDELITLGLIPPHDWLEGI